MVKNGTKSTWKCDKRKSHLSSKLHMIYMSSNNVRHPVKLVNEVCNNFVSQLCVFIRIYCTSTTQCGILNSLANSELSVTLTSCLLSCRLCPPFIWQCGCCSLKMAVLWTASSVTSTYHSTVAFCWQNRKATPLSWRRCIVSRPASPWPSVAAECGGMAVPYPAKGACATAGTICRDLSLGPSPWRWDGVSYLLYLFEH